MERDKTCFFTGHRIIPNGEYDRVNRELEKIIRYLVQNEGVTDFISGAALGFDTVCAKTVIKLKKYYPDIKIHLYIPCTDQSRLWRESDKRVWAELMKQVDSYIFVTNTTYTNWCMHKRNRKMADDAKYCIAYCTRPKSGTGKTVQYAESINDEIFWI